MLFVQSPLAQSQPLHLDPLMATFLTPAHLSLSLCRCNNENEWYQIHENIVRKSNTKYSAPSTNYGKSVISTL